MNIQNINSLPDYIDKFIKFNLDKLNEIYKEGINMHDDGLLYSCMVGLPPLSRYSW